MIIIGGKLIVKGSLVGKVFILCLFFYGDLTLAKTVKVYSWWDYISNDVIKNLEKNDFEIDVTVYTSNNQAISRIYNDKQIDFFIISVLVVDVLKKYSVFDKVTLLPVSKSRSYIKELDKFRYCLPYLWGPSVFIHNQKPLLEKELNVEKLKKIISTKEGTFNFVDDPSEFYGFVKHNSSCAKKDIGCLKSKYLDLAKYLKPTSFKIELDKNKVNKPYLYYGWLGTGYEFNKKHNAKMYFQLPEKIVISQDYLCMSKNSQLSKSDALRFAQNFTNKENTSLNMRDFGYFSPYEKDFSNLNSDMKQLKIQTEKKIKAGDYVLIPNTNDSVFNEVNIIWNKIRYGKK